MTGIDIAIDVQSEDITYRDIVITNGDLVLVSGTDAIEQHILQRLSTFLGEWFLDNTIGVPYFQSILVKNPDQGRIDSILIDKIRQTPGVEKLLAYSSTPDFINRRVSITFKAKTTTGIVDYSGALEA